MSSAIDLLSVKEWRPAHAGEVTYTAGTPTQETPPAAPTDQQGVPDPDRAWRFARVQAHSADLLARPVANGGAAPTLGSGDYRIFAGSAETLQLAYGMTVYVTAASGTATGAVIFGH